MRSAECSSNIRLEGLLVCIGVGSVPVLDSKPFGGLTLKAGRSGRTGHVETLCVLLEGVGRLSSGLDVTGQWSEHVVVQDLSSSSSGQHDCASS